MTRYGGRSRLYLILLGIAATTGGAVAAVSDNLNMGFAAAVVGLYFLHLYSVRDMHEQWRKLRGTERLLAELGFSDGPMDRAGVPAHSRDPGTDGGGSAVSGGGRRETADGAPAADFAPGTVALIEGLMTPEEVSRALAIGEDEPGRDFGELALELGYLTPEGLDELERSRQEDVFDTERIEAARRRLRAYRDELRARAGE